MPWLWWFVDLSYLKYVVTLSSRDLRISKADNSGTIEAAEFIGPLSRWAHDSKTAPRFIKYNMLQTMQLQEDLYDMCADCFKHLSLQIDKVACEVKLLRRKGKEPPATSAPSEEQTPTTSRDLMQRLSQPKSHAKSSVVEGNDEASPSPISPESPNSPDDLELGPRASQSRGSIIELGADPHEGQSRQSLQSSMLSTFEPRNSVKGPDVHHVHHAHHDLDLNEELEHVMGLRPSQATMLLTEILGSTTPSYL